MTFTEMLIAMTPLIIGYLLGVVDRLVTKYLNIREREIALKEKEKEDGTEERKEA